MQWSDTLKDVEDLLFPKYEVDVWERALYYFLLRRTHLAGTPTTLVSIQEISQTLSISDWKAREVIRSLADKGPISFDRSRKGHLVRVLLPEDLEILRPSPQEDQLPIDELDFYSGRTYVSALVARENSKCFYCLREIRTESCELDHVVPKASNGQNSFRNVVAACHDCNALKRDSPADDFLRLLFRKNMLSASELESSTASLSALQDGRLVPRI